MHSVWQIRMSVSFSGCLLLGIYCSFQIGLCKQAELCSLGLHTKIQITKWYITGLKLVSIWKYSNATISVLKESLYTALSELCFTVCHWSLAWRACIPAGSIAVAWYCLYPVPVQSRNVFQAAGLVCSWSHSPKVSKHLYFSFSIYRPNPVSWNLKSGSSSRTVAVALQCSILILVSWQSLGPGKQRRLRASLSPAWVWKLWAPAAAAWGWSLSRASICKAGVNMYMYFPLAGHNLNLFVLPSGYMLSLLWGTLVPSSSNKWISVALWCSERSVTSNSAGKGQESELSDRYAGQQDGWVCGTACGRALLWWRFSGQWYKFILQTNEPQHWWK